MAERGRERGGRGRLRDRDADEAEEAAQVLAEDEVDRAPVERGDAVLEERAEDNDARDGADRGRGLARVAAREDGGDGAPARGGCARRERRGGRRRRRGRGGRGAGGRRRRAREHAPRARGLLRVGRGLAAAGGHPREHRRGVAAAHRRARALAARRAADAVRALAAGARAARAPPRVRRPPALAVEREHDVVEGHERRPVRDRHARAADAPHELAEAALHVDGHAGGALVEDRKARAVEEEARHAQALLLAERERLAPVKHRGRAAGAVQEVLEVDLEQERAQLRLRQRRSGRGLQRVQQLVLQRPNRHIGALRDVEDLRGEARVGAARARDAPRRERPEAAEAAEEGGLAGAVGAGDEQVGAGGHLQGEVAHERSVAGRHDRDAVKLNRVVRGEEPPAGGAVARGARAAARGRAHRGAHLFDALCVRAEAHQPPARSRERAQRAEERDDHRRMVAHV